MKRLKLFSALLMCLFALGFTACSACSDDKQDTAEQFKIEDLYGGWKFEVGSKCLICYFSSQDNSGVLIDNANSENYKRSPITYSVDEKVTTLTLTDANGRSTGYSISSLSPEKLVLKYSNGKTYTYNRYNGNIDEEYPKFKKNDLYGGWKCNADDECTVYYFSAEDNSGILVENANIEDYKRSKIAYSVDKKVSTLTVTDASDSIKEYSISSLSPEMLVLKDANGTTYTYNRYNGNIDDEYRIFIMSDIYGGWKGEESVCYFSAEDNNGVFVENANTEDYNRSDITYSLNKKRITLTDANGNAIEYSIPLLTSKKLVLKGSNGKTYKYNRYNGNINEDYPIFKKKDLYGGWKSEVGNECSIYYFSPENNSGIFVKNAQREDYDRSNITYNVGKEVTTLTVTDANGSATEYTISSLSSEELVLKDNSGKTYTYNRYKANIDKKFPLLFKKGDLYGGWKCDAGKESTVYYFSAKDNSGIFVDSANNENYKRRNITYSVDKKVTTLAIDDDRVVYKILSLNKQQLVLDNSGKTYTYNRFNANMDDKYPTTGKINGHEWVDLGLSVKWATCNVGAESPETFGDYFAWGDTEPKDTYRERNCKTYGKPISDISGKSEYDAATVKWGSTWRIPTQAEMQELKDNCVWEWTTQKGVKGYKITSEVTGNSIFLPAAGYRNGSSLNYAGTYGYYWGSTPDKSDVNSAYYLRFGVGYLYWNFRNYGHTVRPVSK